MRLRADTIIGAVLLMLIIVLFSMSFYLPPAPYGTMGPALFPRVLLIALFPLGAALFIKGLVYDLKERREVGKSFADWFDEYRNVLVSYLLFFIFALLLPYACLLYTSPSPRDS